MAAERSPRASAAALKRPYLGLEALCDGMLEFVLAGDVGDRTRALLTERKRLFRRDVSFRAPEEVDACERVHLVLLGTDLSIQEMELEGDPPDWLVRLRKYFCGRAGSSACRAGVA